MSNIIINPKNDKSERKDKIFEFIKDEQFYCAVAYAKVCKLREDEYNNYLEQEVEKLNNEVKEFEEECEEFNWKAEESKKKAEYLENNPEEVKNEVEDIKKQIEELSEKVKEIEKESEEPKEEAEEFKKQIEELSEKVKELEKNPEDVRKEVEDLLKKAEDANNKAKKAQDEAEDKKKEKSDYFDKLYTVLAYAFDDPSHCYKIYDFNFKDKKIAGFKDKKIDSIDCKEYKVFDKEFKDFNDFLFLSIAIRILYANEVINIIDKLDLGAYDLEDDIKELLKNKEDGIVTLLCNFKTFEHVPLSCLENKEIKEKIRLKKDSNTTKIKEFDLEKECKKYFSNNNDDESKIRKKIFDIDSDLYRDCKIAIDKKDSSSLLDGVLMEEFEIYDDIDNDNGIEINSDNLNDYVEKHVRKINRNFKYNVICNDFRKLLNSVFDYLKNINDKQLFEQANTDIDRYIKAYDKIYPNLENLIDKLKIFIYKKNREEREISNSIEKDSTNKENIEKLREIRLYIAGLSVLLYTLYNIKDNISLDYEKEKYTYQYAEYFYVPFLLSDDVLLKVDFLPDFPNFYFADNFLPSINCDEERNKKFFESIIPEGIIIEHAKKFKNLDYSFYNLKSKLENIPDDDNYTTKRVISKYLNKKEIFSEDDINDAKEDSKFDCEDFDGKLELAEVCCQLEDVNILRESSDKAREKAFELYVNFRENIDENFYKWLCETNENFTYFKKVVDIYSQYIDDNSDILADYYLNEKIQKKYKEDTNEFKNISAFLKKYKNYSAVREFLDNGKKIFEQDSLLEYLSNYIKKNNHYFRDSKNDVKLNIIIDDELNDDNIDEESRKHLLNIAKNWEDIFSTIKRTSEIDTKKLRELLYYLGFEVEENGINDKVNDEFIIDAYNNTQYLKTCEITVSDNNNISLNHQLATFIPYIFKNGFRIVFIDENLVLENKLKDLIKFSDRDEISKKHTIVFYNYRLNLNDRRQLSDDIKTMRADNNNLFLFIDRVVILFLLESFSYCLKIAEEKNKEEQKMVDVREILNDLLMSIILPFGFYQPYESMTSAEKTGDKANKDTANKEIMFVGRKEELETIEKKFKGPFMIVYGGRQLGKSLFLRQAGKDINRDKNSIAIYIDLKTETEYDKVLQNIVAELEKKNIVNSKNIENWDQFQSEVNKFLDDPKNEKKKIYLFLDEVDGFITSCKNHIEIISDKKVKGTDKPFKIIKSIFDGHSGRFNVVLAGLNLYIDFKKGFFTENNRIAGQFSKDSDDNFIHIKPFEIEDAVELIERPLHYLGLDFSEDLSLVYLILYNTNYYPCLIQMYCKKMLENMNKNYSLYSNGPIYKIAKRHIQEILIEEQFQEDVKDTFELTLKLNSKGGNEEDYTFKYLANMLALLCYKFGYKSYSLADFQDLAKGSDKQIGRIEKICNLNDKDLSNSLDLLEKLSVFEKVDGKYRFKRFSLFKLMGKTEDDIRKNLKHCLEKDLYKE